MNIKHNMTLKPLSLYIAIASISAWLSACGGSGQDDGSNNATQNEQVFRGLAIDGYVARGTVYLDTNNDGALNPWENFAFTDNQGYFSYNPLSDTDYCDENASENLRQYCLKTNQHQQNVVLRVVDGYDIATGEPFEGQMSTRVLSSTTQNTVEALITPLSSLFTEVTPDDKADLLLHLDLNESDLLTDYLNINNGQVTNTRLLNTALKIHKTVSVLSDRLTDTYTLIGEEVGTPNDATADIYKNLATEILTHDDNLDDALQNAQFVATVLDNTEQTLREIYTRRDLPLPIDMGSPTEFKDFERIIAITNDIAPVINTLILNANMEVPTQNIIGEIKAVESVVIKTLNESNIDPTIDAAITFFTDPDNETLVTSITQSLSNIASDVNTLVRNDFSGNDFDTVEEIEQALAINENIAAFSRIGGKTLKISDLNLGTAPNKLDDFEAEFYFSGDSLSQDGRFDACIKFIDDANANGDIGSTNTRGELVDGYWSLLAPNDNGESFSVLLTIEFLGSTYQTIVKATAPETRNNIDYIVVKTDTTGDISNWHSEDGFIPTDFIPTTNTQCEQRLPSRIGI